MAAMTSVLTLVPTAASSPNAMAMGVPHSSAIIKSRRW